MRPHDYRTRIRVEVVGVAEVMGAMEEMGETEETPGPVTTRTS